MRLAYRLPVLLLCSFATCAQAAAREFEFEPSHSHIMFTVNHLGYSSSPGRFEDFSGSFWFDPDDPTKNRVDVTIDVASVNMFHRLLNAFLLEPEWFNYKQHPTIRFVSKKSESTGEKTFRVTGDLTFYGATRETTLDVTVNRNAPHPLTKVEMVGFTAKALIRRADFGMTNGVPFIGGDIPVHIEVEGAPKGTFLPAQPPWYRPK